MNSSFAISMFAVVGACAASIAASQSLPQRLDVALQALEPQLIAWRRDIHQNPELSNREFRTSKLVAQHLRSLGLPAETGVARTGVVALLKGGAPGPTIVLRADMDALPVTEQLDLPFRSRVTTTYRGDTVGVMHACGHDAHVAILMGVAAALVPMRAELPGNILFVFQPAEEGAPEGEEGGAALMLKEGLFERYRPEAAFALHVHSSLRAGQIGYRSGSFLAASDFFRVVVTGRQSHGARPWLGIDPVVAAAQIVTGLQTVVSREVNITENPAVVTIGQIRGGVRYNIIPDSVEMLGTIRTFDPSQREAVMTSVRRIVEHTATAHGAKASFELDAEGGNPVTANNPALTARMVPSLQRVAGAENVKAAPLQTGAEDFAFFAQRIPSLYFYVGSTPRDQSPLTAPSNHSSLYFVDESAILLGARALAAVAVDYLRAGAAAP